MLLWNTDKDPASPVKYRLLIKCQNRDRLITTHCLLCLWFWFTTRKE